MNNVTPNIEDFIQCDGYKGVVGKIIPKNELEINEIFNYIVDSNHSSMIELYIEKLKNDSKPKGYFRFLSFSSFLSNQERIDDIVKKYTGNNEIRKKEVHQEFMRVFDTIFKGVNTVYFVSYLEDDLSGLFNPTKHKTPVFLEKIPSDRGMLYCGSIFDTELEKENMLYKMVDTVNKNDKKIKMFFKKEINYIANTSTINPVVGGKSKRRKRSKKSKTYRSTRRP